MKLFEKALLNRSAEPMFEKIICNSKNTVDFTAVDDDLRDLMGFIREGDYIIYKDDSEKGWSSARIMNMFNSKVISVYNTSDVDDSTKTLRYKVSSLFFDPSKSVHMFDVKVEDIHYLLLNGNLIVKIRGREKLEFEMEE